MLERCGNEKLDVYKNYGGRGISVCDEWASSFGVFHSWSTASGYKEGLSIERIDNDSGYCPGNCKWATRKEQASNRRNNKYVDYNGERRTIEEWERVLGFSRNVVRSRIKNGWPIEKAMSVPSGGHH
jgi:hypothetical protein